MLTSHDVLRVLLKIPRSHRKPVLAAFREWVRMLEPGAAAKRRRPDRRRRSNPRKRVGNDRPGGSGRLLSLLSLLQFLT